ncbi:MAG: hypothetical protein M3328_06110 [Chloroflexota bacterium]|nr:hypothetical protein [Chloroflexota bacterium]
MLVVVVAVVLAVFATPVLAKVITGTNIDGPNRGDLLDGSPRGDQIYGLRGDDAIWGMEGNDTIFGGSGVDDLFGRAGNDNIIGGPDHDNLWGHSGNDVIRAKDGHKDDVYCGNGVDKAYVDDTKDVRDYVYGKKVCEFINGVAIHEATHKKSRQEKTVTGT